MPEKKSRKPKAPPKTSERLTLITGAMLSGKTLIAQAIAKLAANTIIIDWSDEVPLTHRRISLALLTKRPVIVVACEKDILRRIGYPKLPARHIHIDINQ